MLTKGITFIILGFWIANSQADFGKRICPGGYFFAGDDELPSSLSKSSSDMVEVDRTPFYSCYKRVSQDGTDWVTASLACNKDQGHLISFETVKEMERVNKHLWDIPPGPMLTSALRLSDNDSWSQGWIWTGSNSNISEEILSYIKELNDSTKAHGRCLAWTPVLDMVPVLEPVNCLKKSSNFYLCEVRAQTVTYYEWFMTNYLNMTVIVLLVLLVMSLCVFVSMHNFARVRQGRQVYRRRAESLDSPPSYSQCTNENCLAGQLSKMEHFEKKSKEGLARVM